LIHRRVEARSGDDCASLSDTARALEHMFSANLKRNGRKWRTGAILLGSAFGFLGLLWSGLIVYVGLTARAEFAPMDVLTCQAAAAGEPKEVGVAGDQDQGKQASCERKLARKRIRRSEP
jgi:hypothetical protein